jgi:hypothetical protein
MHRTIGYYLIGAAVLALGLLIYALIPKARKPRPRRRREGFGQEGFKSDGPGIDTISSGSSRNRADTGATMAGAENGVPPGTPLAEATKLNSGIK